MEDIIWALRPPCGVWAGWAAPGMWARTLSHGAAAGARWGFPYGALSLACSPGSVRAGVEGVLSFGSKAPPCESGRSREGVGRSMRAQAVGCRHWRVAASGTPPPTLHPHCPCPVWAAGVGTELSFSVVEREAAAAAEAWGARAHQHGWQGSLLHSASDGAARLERRLSGAAGRGGGGAGAAAQQDAAEQHFSMRAHASAVRRFALSEQGALPRSRGRARGTHLAAERVVSPGHTSLAMRDASRNIRRPVRLNPPPADRLVLQAGAQAYAHVRGRLPGEEEALRRRRQDLPPGPAEFEAGVIAAAELVQLDKQGRATAGAVGGRCWDEEPVPVPRQCGTACIAQCGRRMAQRRHVRSSVRFCPALRSRRRERAGRPRRVRDARRRATAAVHGAQATGQLHRSQTAQLAGAWAASRGVLGAGGRCW